MSDRPAQRLPYKTQNYLRIGARPVPGATLMHRAMRGHELVGTATHVNFEPGDVVPSRGDMTRLVERMEVQQLIIGVLHWILDNEDWLQHATLQVSFDGSGSEIGGYELRWHGKVGLARYTAARRAIPQLGERLLRRQRLSSPRYVHNGVVEAMNEVAWCPAKAPESLGAFASPISPDEGREWIERHRQAYQRRMLGTHTAPVATPSRPRRL